MVKRWNSESKDGKDLQDLIANGTITGMNAQEVQAVHDQYQKYPKHSFAENLKRLRKKHEDEAGIFSPMAEPMSTYFFYYTNVLFILILR